MICGFGGSPSERLLFTHDSFKPGPRAVHHKSKLPPRKSSDKNEDASKVEDIQTLGIKSTNIGLINLVTPVRASNPNSDKSHSGTNTVSDVDGNVDVAKFSGDQKGSPIEASSTVKLPYVKTAQDDGGQMSTNGRRSGDSDSNCPSYLRRYRACLRLKGLNFDRAYCVNRTRGQTQTEGNNYTYASQCPGDKRHLRLNPNTTKHEICHDSKTKKLLSEIISKSDIASLTLNLRDDIKARQREANLKNSSANGNDYNSQRRSSCLRSRYGKVETRCPEQIGSVHNSAGRGQARSGGNNSGKKSGGRLLGDVMSPRRLQQLLADHNDGLLPFTFS